MENAKESKVREILANIEAAWEMAGATEIELRMISKAKVDSALLDKIEAIVKRNGELVEQVRGYIKHLEIVTGNRILKEE